MLMIPLGKTLANVEVYNTRKRTAQTPKYHNSLNGWYKLTHTEIERKCKRWIKRKVKITNENENNIKGKFSLKLYPFDYFNKTQLKLRIFLYMYIYICERESCWKRK